jgi:2,3-bisphosphoglycerate-independent phosphoglycerate mutase
MQGHHPKPFLLLILDGWGYRQNPEANAIAAAHKPHWDALWQHYPHTVISGSGCSVGLPDGQMGNSEVGHLNMGAGRVIQQDLTRIDATITNQDFFTHPLLITLLDEARNAHKAVHLLGLLSPGGVHSHENHLHALVQLAAQRKVTSLYVHAFLDGRDTPPQSALASLAKLDSVCKTHHCGQIASLIGRYYAMDRDQRWDRVKKAYELLTAGTADYSATTAQQGLELAYRRGETDEFVAATTVHAENQQPITIAQGDVVIFMNYRADRARELTEAFVKPDFTGFMRKKRPALAHFVTLTEYDKRFDVPVVFPPTALTNTLPEYLSKLGLKQLRIAETEKYAHVTFFFNGGMEKPYPGEERILVPSPKVATYDLKPEMSAPELTAQLVQEIKKGRHDVIIANFANADMVGHSGNFAATVKAIETIDDCLGKIIAALQEVGGEGVITADHGNAECMFDPQTQQPHTAHTNLPIPFLYVGRPALICKENGVLSDIAPTLLYLMGLTPPSEMTGESLVKLV